jgi:hypothetical protein
MRRAHVERLLHRPVDEHVALPVRGGDRDRYAPRLGGAATTLPEYIAKMKTMPKPAKVITGGGEGGN